MLTRCRSPWAYKIDYSQAIREDEAEIGRLTSPLVAAIAPMMSRDLADHPEWKAYAFNIWSFCACCPEERAARMALFGLTEDDMRALAVGSGVSELVTGERIEAQPGDHRRARELWDKWAWLDKHQLLTTEEQRVERLRLAKQRLARHKRAHAKQG